MTERQELIKRARAYGLPGASRMSVKQLRDAIARRRAYLARPAADIPKTTTEEHR